VKKPGACTIPARKLYDYIKLLPDGDISIKLLENHWVQIRSGRSNTKMVGMARANYPQVPEFPPSRRPAFLSLAEDADCAHHLRHLERGVALHAQRRAAGDQGRVAGHGCDRRPPAVVCRKAQRDSGRHQRREARADSAQGSAGAAAVARRLHDAEKVEFADDEHTLFFRVGHRTLSTPQADRAVPEL
jgi:DNA polymerase III subunit beta